MRISKWHEGAKGARRGKAALRENFRRADVAITHHIMVDGATYDAIERVARKRRTSVSRLVDAAINWMLDREAA